MLFDIQNKVYLTKDDFFSLLQKRIFEYSDAIAPNFGAFRLHIVSVWNGNQNTIKRLDAQFDLFGKDFWGYGINSICNGKESHSNHDVTVIKQINELNKHHKYNLLWLVVFKIEKGVFVYSIFCMDVSSGKMHSDTIQQIP